MKLTSSLSILKTKQISQQKKNDNKIKVNAIAVNK